MNDQPVIDACHQSDLRLTRSALHSIIPVDTGLSKGIDRLLPELEGIFGFSNEPHASVDAKSQIQTMRLNYLFSRRS